MKALPTLASIAVVTLMLVIAPGCENDIEPSCFGTSCVDAAAAEVCGEPPGVCATHCISPLPVNGIEDCCDSVTCYCNPASNGWEVHYCDAPVLDAGASDAQ